MKRSISCLFFLSCMMILTPLYAATQTLTSYYPAPQGDYKNMTVNNILTIGAGGTCGTQSGSAVALVDVGGYLEFCDSTGGPYILAQSISNLWGSSGTLMYPYQVGQDVIIGAGSNPPSNPNGYALSVTGSAGITGNTTIGGNTTFGTSGGTNTTTVYGTMGIGTTPVSGAVLTVAGDTTINPSSDFTVNGSSILGATGSATPSTTTINGDTTIIPTTNGLQVNGNTSLGTTSTPNTSNVLQVNGQATVNGNTAPGIYICPSGGPNAGSSLPNGGCGYLAVAQSSTDGNYYAVYGP